MVEKKQTNELRQDAIEKLIELNISLLNGEIASGNDLNTREQTLSQLRDITSDL